MLIDIHTHIQQHDPSEVSGMLQRAADAGVSKIIAAGTTIEDSKRAIALAEQFHNVYARCRYTPVRPTTSSNSRRHQNP